MSADSSNHTAWIAQLAADWDRSTASLADDIASESDSQTRTELQRLLAGACSVRDAIHAYAATLPSD